MEKIDVAVVGAGVIGLAVARALAMKGRDVLILEAEGAFGTVTSSRNSEVIHAGLYYPTGSLKARLCVEGRDALYRYCEERGVAYRKCGKLVVATNESERAYLDSLFAKAHANGVADVAMLDAAALDRLEPALAGVAALLSPSTGIIDSHGFMLSLLGEAEAAGASLALRAPVEAGRILSDRIILRIGGEDPMEIEASFVVNAAGLGAWSLARRLEGLDHAALPPRHFAKGSYFTLQGRAPFSHLIYPVPEPGGLGVHLTLDLAGQARFGPDVEWMAAQEADAIDYRVDPARAEPFYAAIRRYWPDLPDGRLAPAYSGVRPKVSGPGEPAGDFVAQASGPYLGLYGFESPGLTASLAIGARAAQESFMRPLFNAKETE